MAGMIYLVVAPTLQWFKRDMIDQIIEPGQLGFLLRGNKFLVGDDEYIFIGHEIDKLRGRRGVKVLIWGPYPQDWGTEWQWQIRQAEMK